ncbi:MAG: hypothetical protein AAF805_05775, partial [Planctomycetota bacterium]
MSKAKLLAVALVWLVLIGVGVLAWRLVFAPVVERAAEEQAAEQRRRGGSDSRFDRTLTLRLDGFSGYAVLRSDPFKDTLAKGGVGLRLVDDGADYPARLAALKSGEADLAVFTIDALVKASAEAGSMPATIVAVIDETAGADAVVAYRDVYGVVGDLNDPGTRFVLTPDSPSETLARVVMSRFDLDRLPADPFEPAADAADVVKRYRAAKAADRRVYVVWEPHVTQMLKNDRLHVLVDSSRFPSAIADVLVASDDLVAKDPAVVTKVLRAYFDANARYADKKKRIDLVRRDARATGAKLSEEEARRLVEGVWWKNAAENRTHLGLADGRGARAAKLPHLDDLITRITEVLVGTGAIDADPTGGNPNYLYNTAVWSPLADYRPAGADERVRGVRMPALSDSEWESLVEVGAAQAPTLVFARGTDRLTERSRVLLDELAGT